MEVLLLGQGSTVSNLPPSVNYQLQVTDANGCQSLAFASLSEPSEIQVLTSVVTPAYCEDVATEVLVLLRRVVL